MKENMKDILTIILTLVVGVILYKIVGWTFRLIWISVILVIAYFLVTTFIITDNEKDNNNFDL